MKTLIALSAVQTIGILVLVVMVTSRPETSPVPATSELTALRADASAEPAFDDARLRRIIREELQALVVTRASAGAEPAPPARDPIADAEQKDYVEQQLAYYISVGELSGNELVTFERELAQLNPADRREILNRLARAVNLGHIKAQL